MGRPSTSHAVAFSFSRCTLFGPERKSRSPSLGPLGSTVLPTCNYGSVGVRCVPRTTALESTSSGMNSGLAESTYRACPPPNADRESVTSGTMGRDPEARPRGDGRFSRERTSLRLRGVLRGGAEEIKAASPPLLVLLAAARARGSSARRRVVRAHAAEARK
jgi:hypothetical protein